MKRIFLPFVALLGLSISCLAEGESGFLAAKIGVMEFREREDYDKNKEGNGLGESWRFEGDDWLKADVYLYDKNLKGLLSGIDSAEVKGELKAIAMTLAKIQEIGKYADLKELGSGQKTFGEGDKEVKFLWSRHSYRQTESSGFPGARVSDTFIRITNGKFLKIRITTMEKNLAKDQPAIDTFMAEVAKRETQVK